MIISLIKFNFQPGYLENPNSVLGGLWQKKGNPKESLKDLFQSTLNDKVAGKYSLIYSRNNYLCYILSTIY